MLLQLKIYFSDAASENNAAQVQKNFYKVHNNPFTGVLWNFTLKILQGKKNND